LEKKGGPNGPRTGGKQSGKGSIKGEGKERGNRQGKVYTQTWIRKVIPATRKWTWHCTER